MTDWTWLWVPATLMAAAAQTVRNAMQRELTGPLGTVGAAQIRFLYGLPFAFLFWLLLFGLEGGHFPQATPGFFGQLFIASTTQIAATVLMLATMQRKGFALSTVYIKTEPVMVALFGVLLLGETLAPWAVAAVLIATAGVMVMSWRTGNAWSETWAPALLGISAGALFAWSSVSYRAAILALSSGGFLLKASTALTAGLLLQCLLILVWLLGFKRAVLLAILRSWRASIKAGFMGALASQCWFIGFALTSATYVRTLGLVEVLFAQWIAIRWMRQRPRPAEYVGLALVLLGLVLLSSGFLA
ncbi:MAG: EamA family transporter [Pigmentiphaga sp.]